ncbi:MAG: CsgG/HfaB family protein [Treponema sp.]|jgi:hypothetical protein|nr:CsgG/HfaB family protein [Treponema sp.]
MKYVAGFFYGALLVLGVMSFIACATMVPIEVTKLPTIDTGGIKRLAVMPFGTSDNSGLQKQVAHLLTSMVNEVIVGTNHFTPVAATEVLRLEQAGQSYANMVDALFTGEIIAVSVRNSSHTEKYTDYSDKNPVERTRTIYDREVKLDFTYRLVRARDGSIISQVNKSGTASDHKEKLVELSTPFDLAQIIVQRILRLLGRDVAPWRITEKRTLEKETTKDKELKRRMQEAEAQVKVRSYKVALKAYNKIYEDTGSFAAAYNAAIMTEVLGDLPEAIVLMRQLEDETGNPKAGTELARMEQTFADSRTLEEQYSGSDTLVDSAINQASANIIAKLPGESRVSILNISAVESQLMEYIIGEMTTAMVNTGTITIIDRQNLQLVTAEKQFQASGEVSDESAVSIGHMLGVNTIITCAITGSSNLRRLRIRALRVETGAIIYQDSLAI